MDIPLLLSIIGAVLGLVQLIQAHRQNAQLVREIWKHRVGADSEDAGMLVSVPNILLWVGRWEPAQDECWYLPSVPAI